jgi:MFS transporter, SP family, arabinose:H+ symporter
MPSRSTRNYLLCLVLIASLGGFLFGYDTAVISGTIGFVKEKFALDAVMEGWYVSSALVGCLVGVAVAGFLSDRFGRKRILLLSAILFSVSGIGCAVAATHLALTAYRIVGGLGIGVASMLSPLYISEIAPSHIRGRMVALYQFAITIGILFSYFVNAWLLHIAQSAPPGGSGWIHHIFVAEVWRGMLGSETIPALLFFLLLLFVPESPRWLVARGQDALARHILTRIEGEEIADREIKEIKETVSRESGSLRILFEPGIRLALLLGVALAFLTQVSGINAIIYYGPRILEDAGFTLGDALGGQVVIGIVNVVFTLVAIWKIDDLGRRPLLIVGVSGIVASLVVIGFLFKFNVTSGLWLMTFILLFIACFAFSFGPVIWVLLSEMYPTRVRGRAMSIATLSLWTGTALVGQTVPWLLENLQPYGTFWLFALLCSPAIYLGWKVLPETKEKSLEEIEQYWLSMAEVNRASATPPRQSRS